MAGLNKSLKAGTVVFKAGENADGMYLVRKGELIVYLEQGGKEVVLAKIPEGGMVGEMALFDRMPRSASVKASIDTEITHISLDDFGKLMKQIPKWFVGLMSALSGRLRTTNDRLKALESGGGAAPAPASSPAPAQPGSAKPFQNLIRTLNVMELLWHRDGSKEGKDWMIPKATVVDELTGTFGEPAEKVTALLELLCADNILVAKLDSMKKSVIAMPNRGSLRQFTSFVSSFTKSNPNVVAVPEPVMNILKILTKQAANAPYDPFTATYEEIADAGKAAGMNIEQWKTAVSGLPAYGECIKPTKTSSPTGIGLRITKAELPALVKSLTVFNKLSAKKLEQ